METQKAADIKAMKIKRVRKIIFWEVVAVIVFILAGQALSPYYKIGFNGTASVDGYVFLIEKNVLPKKGELAAFWPPENSLTKNIWFVKYIKGVGGDVVTKNENAFYINGEFIGEAKTKSSKGLDLESSDAGTIPPHSYFVWTGHPKSFDSRYKQIGWIPKNNVFGRAIRIF